MQRAPQTNSPGSTQSPSQATGRGSASVLAEGSRGLKVAASSWEKQCVLTSETRTLTRLLMTLRAWPTP